MFRELASFRNVYVVGPQRSGTRIAATMIAADTGHPLMDERRFSCDSLSRLYTILEDPHMAGAVIQAPGLTRWAHHLATPADAVVFMVRALEDIQASEDRIGWKHAYVEAMKYGEGHKHPAKSKVEFWMLHQRNRIANAYTVRYASLESHPLWVPDDLRRRFKWDQTK